MCSNSPLWNKMLLYVSTILGLLKKGVVWYCLLQEISNILNFLHLYANVDWTTGNGSCIFLHSPYYIVEHIIAQLKAILITTIQNAIQAIFIFMLLGAYMQFRELTCLFIKRSGVAGAVLQTPSSPFHSVGNPFPPNLQNIITPKNFQLGTWHFGTMFTTHSVSGVTSPVSCVICYMSNVRCQMTCVTFWYKLKILIKIIYIYIYIYIFISY